MAKRAMSAKHIIIPSTLEWVVKRPGPQSTTDTFTLLTVIAGKIKSVRFSKLKKFKRDYSHALDGKPDAFPFHFFTGTIKNAGA